MDASFIRTMKRNGGWITRNATVSDALKWAGFVSLSSAIVHIDRRAKDFGNEAMSPYATKFRYIINYIACT